MNTTAHAYRVGGRRALIETRISLTTPADVIGYLMPLAILITVLLFLRGVDLDGSPISLGATSMPSLIGMMIVYNGVLGVTGTLVMDRTNGTMLRAKSMPGGMIGYLMGHMGSLAIFTAGSVVVQLVVGLILFDGLEFGSPDRWLSLAAVVALGMAATMPIGAALGALIDNPRNMAVVMLPFMALTAVSGIFYPLTALPGWLQAVGQFFPVYWLGLGTRAALLPDAAAAVEVGGQWRTLTMFTVLAAWAIVSLAVAPKLLSRMAKRESGSSVASRREQLTQDWA